MSRSQARRTSESNGAIVCAGGYPTRSTVGALAAASWLSSRGLPDPGMLRWHVEIAMGTTEEPVPAEFDENVATRFHIAIYSEEWGVFLCHGGRWSWIRVTDLAFIHTRDDFGLLARVPPLDQLGSLLRGLEREHNLSFRRDRAIVHTNLSAAEPAVRTWLAGL